MERERNDEAARYADAALVELATSERQVQATEALGVRALCKARRGDARGAITDATGALGAKEKLFGERADIVPLLARGASLLAVGRAPEALADLERATTIADATKGDVAIRAEVRFALARALRASAAETTRATALATRAAGDLESVKLPKPRSRCAGGSRPTARSSLDRRRRRGRNRVASRPRADVHSAAWRRPLVPGLPVAPPPPPPLATVGSAERIRIAVAEPTQLVVVIETV